MSAAKVASLVVVLGSLALAREANAETGYDRLGFFPGHLRGKVTADPTQCGVATYCGGPVISNVQIVTVFWTDQVSQVTQQWAAGYASTIASSALIDMLSEYSTKGVAGTACGAESDAGIGYFGPPTPFSTGQTITRGSATQAYTIVPKTLTGSSFDDDNALVGAELVAQIQAGALPPPVYDAQGYPDTLYMVYFPPSVSITSFGEQSCVGFDGYHYSAPYAASGCKGQYLPYAVILDCGLGEGAQLSDVVSHELAESITDTDVGPTTPPTADYGDGAWYLGPSNPCTNNNCPQNCGEVGDVCEAVGDGTVPGTSIVSQDIWSNVQNSCVLSNPNIGPQNGPAPVPACIGETGSDAGAGGSGVDAGGGGGGAGSSSGGGRGTSGGGGGEGSSVDAGIPTVDAGGSDDGGNADMSFGGPASGCGCAVIGKRASSEAAVLGVLVGFALIGRSRRKNARR